MMRRGRIPHPPCGSTRVCSRPLGRLRLVYALALLTTLAVALTLASVPSSAQDPSLKMGATQRKSSFPKKDLFGPPPKIDQAQPLYLQADQLLYDTKSSRVIAQGNVEVYYNNYILTADQLVGALVGGLNDNNSPAELAAVKVPVNELVAILLRFKDVDVKKNDVLTMDFVDGGTRVALNGEARGVIQGEAFNGALTRIWLGDKPAQGSLKKAMLGG